MNFRLKGINKVQVHLTNVNRPRERTLMGGFFYETYIGSSFIVSWVSFELIYTNRF